MSLDYTPLGNAIAQLEKSLVYANSSAAMADPSLRQQCKRVAKSDCGEAQFLT
jgi:hypothetical protein